MLALHIKHDWSPRLVIERITLLASVLDFLREKEFIDNWHLVSVFFRRRMPTSHREARLCWRKECGGKAFRLELRLPTVHARERVTLVTRVGPRICVEVGRLAIKRTGGMHDSWHRTTVLGNAGLIVGLALKMRYFIPDTGNTIVVIDEISARPSSATMLVQTTAVLIQRARTIHDVGASLHLCICPVGARMEGNLIATDTFTSVIVKVDSSGILKVQTGSI
jgi:hypothetical protein